MTDVPSPPTLQQMLPGILIAFLLLVCCFVYVAVYVFRLIRGIGDEHDKDRRG